MTGLSNGSVTIHIRGACVTVSKLLTALAAQVGAVLVSLPLAVSAPAAPTPTPAPAPAAPTPAPAPSAQTTQWIVVGVPKADATGVHRTPVGTFAFDQAFGREPNPGTKMPYFQATKQDWWDEDASSPTYNTHVRSAASPSAVTENLYDSGPVYDYAINMAVNPQRIPGKVSGIFLHVTDGTPTWGCVAIGREQMKSILTWLDPAANPRITVGVGDPGLLPAKS